MMHRCTFRPLAIANLSFSRFSDYIILGGATEYGRALSMAAKQASQVASQSGFNVYSIVSMPAAGQYYAAPSDIYQPNYPVGFVLPTQQFNDVPQQGTIYYQNAPPPYPGKCSLLVTASPLID